MKLVLVLKCAALSSTSCSKQTSSASGWNPELLCCECLCSVGWAVPGSWSPAVPHGHGGSRRMSCQEDLRAGLCCCLSIQLSTQGSLANLIFCCNLVRHDGGIREYQREMISQLPGIRGRMGLVQSKGFWVNPIPCQSDLGEGAASCYFLSVHLPPSTTPGYSCHTSVVYPLPYLLFSSSSPPPGFCLGSCTISAFPSLRKMQIKSFTVLKHNF